MKFNKVQYRIRQRSCIHFIFLPQIKLVIALIMNWSQYSRAVFVMERISDGSAQVQKRVLALIGWKLARCQNSPKTREYFPHRFPILEHVFKATNSSPFPLLLAPEVLQRPLRATTSTPCSSGHINSSYHLTYFACKSRKMPVKLMLGQLPLEISIPAPHIKNLKSP